MSKPYIAQVATAAIVDGKRVVIQPGEPLPMDLPAADLHAFGAPANDDAPTAAPADTASDAETDTDSGKKKAKPKR